MTDALRIFLFEMGSALRAAESLSQNSLREQIGKASEGGFHISLAELHFSTVHFQGVRPLE